MKPNQIQGTKERGTKRSGHDKKEGKDPQGVQCVRDKSRVLKEQVKERAEVWQEYCKRLMNVENEWDRVVNAEQVFGRQEEVTVQEVREAYKKMEKGRAAGPSTVCAEMLGKINCLNVVCQVVNEVLAE